ncbi:enolase C-terminal domain-like protein [Sulfitobacter sp. D35]|uniref:enolase C-terminal domain-like protein n=1 Tax=Sulfitobacter sp. D35 TaxID=3083252 RepID=UPI00296F1D63|nr:enolase C-terminal domain-like protein [Sulfitobacter sp. D35]MDW4497209.1 enolase C-terminal domain-like protein [Sulfitobacter sp. D35]
MIPGIARAWFREERVTDRTTWLFVGIEGADGVMGFGEATLAGSEAEVRAAASLLPAISDWRDTDPDAAQTRLPFDTLPQAALSSAVLQALWDLEARQKGLPLAVALGGVARPVPVYANINRRTRDRSPEGMARSASDALAAGHRAIKIAPFDEVRPDLGRTEMTAAAEPGLARIAAVRAAIGDRRLMIDCHWRFNAEGAARMIDAVAPLDPHWVECPVAETEAAIPAIRRLRERANAHGMRLAGLETRVLLAGFRPYLEAGAYDVMMPDMKYAGGPSEMLRIAAELRRHGVVFSPHNPSGPICHAHSLHLCAALEDADLLEMQFDETPAFDALVDHALPQVTKGAIALSPDRPGIGVSLGSEATQ